MAAINRLPCGFLGTGEGIRLAVMLPPPHHHNAWGAVIRMAVRRGLLMDTGQMAHMTSKKSHARRSPVYRRTVLRFPAEVA